MRDATESQWRPATKRETTAQLIRLKKASWALALALRDIKSPAEAALGAVSGDRFGAGFWPHELDNFSLMLWDLVECVEAASPSAKSGELGESVVGFYPSTDDLAKSLGTIPLKRGAGRPTSIEPKAVAARAGRAFLNVTGRRPTFTTCPMSSRISGEWPDFLAAVFDALDIRASAGSQARAVSAKMQREKLDSLT